MALSAVEKAGKSITSRPGSAPGLGIKDTAVISAAWPPVAPRPLFFMSSLKRLHVRPADLHRTPGRRVGVRMWRWGLHTDVLFR
jgi:hypothetical protein